MTSCQNFSCPIGKTLISNPTSQLCNNNECTEEQCCIDEAQIEFPPGEIGIESTTIPILSPTLLFNQKSGGVGSSCGEDSDCLTNYCYSGRCILIPQIDRFSYDPIECSIRKSCELGVECSSDDECKQQDELVICDGLIYDETNTVVQFGVCTRESDIQQPGPFIGQPHPQIGNDPDRCWELQVCNDGIQCGYDNDCLNNNCSGAIVTANGIIQLGSCSPSVTPTVTTAETPTVTTAGTPTVTTAGTPNDTDTEVNNLNLPTNSERTEDLPEGSTITINFEIEDTDINEDTRNKILLRIEELIDDELNLSLREIDNVERFTIGSSKVSQLLEIKNNPDDVQCDDINDKAKSIEESIKSEFGVNINFEKTKCYNISNEIFGLSYLNFGILVGVIIFVIIIIFFIIQSNKPSP